MMEEISRGGEPSLKDGRGARHAERNPRAGTKPLSDFFMQIVPPVIIIRTRDSGPETGGLLMRVSLETFLIWNEHTELLVEPRIGWEKARIYSFEGNI